MKNAKNVSVRIILVFSTLYRSCKHKNHNFIRKFYTATQIFVTRVPFRFFLHLKVRISQNWFQGLITSRQSLCFQSWDLKSIRLNRKFQTFPVTFEERKCLYLFLVSLNLHGIFVLIPSISSLISSSEVLINNNKLLDE